LPEDAASSLSRFLFDATRFQTVRSGWVAGLDADGIVIIDPMVDRFDMSC
jgi:hypothetical protein